MVRSRDCAQSQERPPNGPCPRGARPGMAAAGPHTGDREAGEPPLRSGCLPTLWRLERIGEAERITVPDTRCRYWRLGEAPARQT